MEERLLWEWSELPPYDCWHTLLWLVGIKRVSNHVCSWSWSKLKCSRGGVINDYCPLLSSTESESVLTLLPELPPVPPPAPLLLLFAVCATAEGAAAALILVLLRLLLLLLNRLLLLLMGVVEWQIECAAAI